MPYPQNVAVAKEVEAICRQAGAVPATIAVINGFPKVGLHDADFELLGKAEQNKVRNPLHHHYYYPHDDYHCDCSWMTCTCFLRAFTMTN